MSHEWRPGDVALVTMDGVERRAVRSEDGSRWVVEPRPAASPRAVTDARPLVVIDPEDLEQVERLVERMAQAKVWAVIPESIEALHAYRAEQMQAALLEFAKPVPAEPTDPRARVEDRRENIWRLLADGDWVCTSGPDIGEYLDWSRLADRGPLTIEVVS